MKKVHFTDAVHIVQAEDRIMVEYMDVDSKWTSRAKELRFQTITKRMHRGSWGYECSRCTNDAE
jgi:hypothetical protein